jgi:quercetin dioxygenase-like cupin family protein
MLSSQSEFPPAVNGPTVEGSMHVGPADFRSIRRDGLLLRFAILGEVAYVLAEVPPSGSAGTALEVPCERPHWAFVVAGEVELDAAPDPDRVTIPAGSAFHIADGTRHRIRAMGRTRLAGFERIDPRADVSDSALKAQGFEVLAEEPAGSPAIVPVIEPVEEPIELGDVVPTGSRMGGLLFCQVRFGQRSGYASPFCDLPHWGQVTAGNIAIEWENDIEVLTAGDVFYCPPGPPGHRFQAADPSAIVDFTPFDAFSGDGRMADWRHALAIRTGALAAHPGRGVEVATLR